MPSNREVMAQINCIRESSMLGFWHYVKQQSWLMLLPLLLLAAFGAKAVAAPSASFSATTSGTINNLNLTANIGIADADQGRVGNIYLGFRLQQIWLLNNGSGWVRYEGGPLPIYAAGPLTTRSIEVARNADLSSLVGGQLYVGYGLTEAELSAKSQYGLIYTVVADTTAPTVSATVIANGATSVPISASIGATLSEAMDPATLNAQTVKLSQGSTLVPGSVSYSGLSVVFLPTNPLSPNTSYTATITGGGNGAKDLAGNALLSDYSWSWTTAAAPSRLAPVLLGTAGNFAILAKTAISTVPTSVVTGDIAVSPAAATFITGFSLIADASNVFATSTQVVGGGRVYAANYAVPSPSNLTTAVLDMQTAYTDAAGRPTPDFLNLGSGNIGGLTLAPGLYKWGSTLTIPTDVVISGSANDVWIFQISGDLTMSAAKRITLAGGALAKNVFWQVAGQVTIGTTSHFEGIVLSQTAINLQTGATLNGRLLAQSMVALDSAVVTKPAP